MGTVVLLRRTYDKLAMEYLSEAFVTTDMKAIDSCIIDAKAKINNIVKFGTQFGMLHDKDGQFVTCFFYNYRLPIARLLIKITEIIQTEGFGLLVPDGCQIQWRCCWLNTCSLWWMRVPRSRLIRMMSS